VQAKRKILGACLGNCVHVAGILSFLDLAQSEGYETQFLGAATPLDQLVIHIARENPDIVAISYRLTPEVAHSLLCELKKIVQERHWSKKISFILGGTEPVAEVARDTGLFEAIFSADSKPREILSYLRRKSDTSSQEKPPQDIITRIEYNRPYPVLRHHYGRPTLEETLEGVGQIAESGLLDVISLGPDQNAQQSFFKPNEMDATLSGSGGVPIRTDADLEALYLKTRRGNFPLLRCYSGTNDLIQMGELLQSTIHNAWAAIPLCWYNVLDGRSKRGLEESIVENLEAIAWHAKRRIPVEINEPHQWSLRNAHDAITVATAYLAAHNAKKRGVNSYISQYMLNTPAQTSDIMDAAKVLAQIEQVETLHDQNFRSFRELRAGLYSFPQDQEAASTYLAIAFDPHIYHVVGYTEGHHAAMAQEVIASCKIARQVIENRLKGIPNCFSDQRIAERKEELISESNMILKAICEIASPGTEDPLSDVDTIAKAIRAGILDAPYLADNPVARGKLITKQLDGAYYAFDPVSNRVVPERERIDAILSRHWAR
jgi:methylmalonyl-CoA mutase cobalamin-binding subunit